MLESSGCCTCSTHQTIVHCAYCHSLDAIKQVLAEVDHWFNQPGVQPEAFTLPHNQLGRLLAPSLTHLAKCDAPGTKRLTDLLVKWLFEQHRGGT